MARSLFACAGPAARDLTWRPATANGAAPGAAPRRPHAAHSTFHSPARPSHADLLAGYPLSPAPASASSARPSVGHGPLRAAAALLQRSATGAAAGGHRHRSFGNGAGSICEESCSPEPAWPVSGASIGGGAVTGRTGNDGDGEVVAAVAGAAAAAAAAAAAGGSKDTSVEAATALTGDAWAAEGRRVASGSAGGLGAAGGSGQQRSSDGSVAATAAAAAAPPPPPPQGPAGKEEEEDGGGEAAATAAAALRTQGSGMVSGSLSDTVPGAGNRERSNPMGAYMLSGVAMGGAGAGGDDEGGAGGFAPGTIQVLDVDTMWNDENDAPGASAAAGGGSASWKATSAAPPALGPHAGDGVPGAAGSGGGVMFGLRAVDVPSEVLELGGAMQWAEGGRAARGEGGRARAEEQLPAAVAAGLAPHLLE